MCPRLVRPTNLMSRMNGKKTHKTHMKYWYERFFCIWYIFEFLFFTYARKARSVSPCERRGVCCSNLYVKTAASFRSSLDSREEAPASTMSSECTLGCALFMWLASVDVPAEPLHANKAPHGCIFPYLETSTEHPNGWFELLHHFQHP